MWFKFKYFGFGVWDYKRYVLFYLIVKIDDEKINVWWML